MLDGTLPQVSWVVNNQFFSEHPVTAPSNGAYFLHGVLEALNADPDVFNSTLVIINYDENDGQFDHVAAAGARRRARATSSSSGTLAQYGVTAAAPGRPRLPGAADPHLAVDPRRLGDLGGLRPHLGDPVPGEVDHRDRQAGRSARTSASGGARSAATSPAPSTSARRSTGCRTCPTPATWSPRPAYTPLPGNNTMPTQETGTKRARPLPYQPNANLTGFATAAAPTLAFSNDAPFVTKASHFAVYNNLGGFPTLADYPARFPGQYTVAPPRSRRPAGAGPVGSTGDLRPHRHRAEPVPAPLHRRPRHRGQGPGRRELLRPGLQAEVRAQPGEQLAPAVTFTVTHNHYGSAKPVRRRVRQQDVTGRPGHQRRLV